MSEMKNKLNNKKGATIVLSLLLLLVALTVGLLLLTSSVTTIKALNEQKNEQQAYLSVSSAAQIVVDALTSAENSYKGDIDIIYSDKNHTDKVDEYSTHDTDFAKGMFGDLVNKGIKWLDTDEANMPNAKMDPIHFTMSVDGVSDLAPVTGTFSMKKNGDSGEYIITVELEDADKYKCNIMINGSRQPEQTSEFITQQLGQAYVTETEFVKTDPGKGHYEIKVEYVGNGKGNRIPKGFKKSDNGNINIIYEYVGKNQGSFTPIDVTYAKQHDGDLQGEYQGVDLANSGNGKYKYISLSKTTETNGEYNPIYKATKKGEGYFSATAWEWYTGTDADSLGVYSYNEETTVPSLSGNHYDVIWDTVTKTDAGDYNAVYTHAEKNDPNAKFNPGSFKESSNNSGDYRKNSYYYFPGQSTIDNKINHYTLLNNPESFYKNEYDGLESFEHYIKGDGASGDFIRVTQDDFKKTKSNKENGELKTDYYVEFIPTTFYERLCGNKITSAASAYIGYYFSNLYYKESESSNEIKSQRGRDVAYAENLIRYHFYDQFANITFYDDKETDYNNPIYPSSNTYYYLDEETKAFVEVSSSEIEANRAKYTGNVYIKISKSEFESKTPSKESGPSTYTGENSINTVTKYKTTASVGLNEFEVLTFWEGRYSKSDLSKYFENSSDELYYIDNDGAIKTATRTNYRYINGTHDYYRVNNLRDDFSYYYQSSNQWKTVKGSDYAAQTKNYGTLYVITSASRPNKTAQFPQKACVGEVQVLDIFYYVFVGEKKGLYNDSFEPDENGNYIRLTASQYDNRDFNDAYEYIGDGKQDSEVDQLIEADRNGSYKIDHFVYAKLIDGRKSGEYNLKFIKSDTGKYGLISLDFVGTGGDHRATEFVEVEDGGNYDESGEYVYVQKGGSYKATSFKLVEEDEKGDFDVVGYRSAPGNGDHKAGDYQAVPYGTGDFNMRYEVVDEGIKGEYEVTGWTEVDIGGDFQTVDGEYVPKVGGDFDKKEVSVLKDDQLIDYYGIKHKVEISWNNVEIKKGGIKDEQD